MKWDNSQRHSGWYEAWVGQGHGCHSPAPIFSDSSPPSPLLTSIHKSLVKPPKIACVALKTISHDAFEESKGGGHSVPYPPPWVFSDALVGTCLLEAHEGMHALVTAAYTSPAYPQAPALTCSVTECHLPARTHHGRQAASATISLVTLVLAERR